MTTTTSPFRNMADVRAANKAAGQIWFSPGSMSWFKSKVETQLYRGRYFLTSEAPGVDGEESQRMWTVRRAEDDGTISNVGEFMQHQTHDAALAAMWEHINAEAGTS